jgi:hypothetical protein
LRTINKGLKLQKANSRSRKHSKGALISPGLTHRYTGRS